MADSVSVTELHVVLMISDNAGRVLAMWPELEEWRKELAMMKNYLMEVERKEEVAYNELFIAWLAELRSIANEVEDVIDTSVVESRTLFRLPWDNKPTKKLRSLLEQMQAIKTKLEVFVTHMENSPKDEVSLVQSSEGDEPEDDVYVVGLDEDVNKLVQQLVSKSVDVLAIVGMGGSGKTTRARKIYEHWSVKWRHFNCRVWILFSQCSSASEVLSEILQQISGSGRNTKSIDDISTDEGHQLEVLGTQIRNMLRGNILRGKTCLLVLDDVWEFEYLGKVLSALLPGNDESTKVNMKIIITSRTRVPLPTNTHLQWDFHQTQLLSEDDSWQLLNKMASKDGRGLGMDYEVLAKEMLRKCQGLPLAIVALGKHLKTKDTILEWEGMFSLMEGPEGAYLFQPVNNILGLSYDALPYYLKPCFLYLGLFPKSSIISTGTLIRMWIAEGFISKHKDDDTLEGVARGYVLQLSYHNMIQVVRRNYAQKVKAVQVHDLMWDFCVMAAEEIDFASIPSSNHDVDGRSSRRTAINLRMNLLPLQNSHLRSLVLLGQLSFSSKGHPDVKERNQVALNLAQICENFKLLRVLDLCGIQTSDGTLPKEIGNFFHLRYLRIRSTNIRELPKSIGKLRNLLTLDYWDVSFDSGIIIPNVLYKLKLLRQLFLPNEMNKVTCELKLHSMKDLQVLWGIGGGNWIMKGMKDLGPSLKKLYIQGVSSLEQMNAVFNCTIVECLSTLALDWYGFDLESLEQLCSKNNLKKLRLMGKASDQSQPFKFPSELEKLGLYFTQLINPDTMLGIGSLRFLKSLRLSKESYVGTKWTCNSDDFPVLEELKLCNLRKLEEWKIVEGSMSCLKKLSIISCVSLTRIPEGLKSIHTLENLEIERMPYRFCSRLQQVKEGRRTITGEDFQIVQHIPLFKIYNACSSTL